MSNPLSVEAVVVRLLVPLQLERIGSSPGGSGTKGEILGEVGRSYVRVRDPGDAYTSEVFPAVRRFVFEGFGTGGFGCWQVASHEASAWFDQTRIELDGATPAGSARARLAYHSGIELFLSDLGVGLLSTSLHLDDFPDLPWLQRLLHGLTTMDQESVTFVRPKPAIPPTKLSAAQLGQVRPAPDRGAPLSERMVRAGGVYSWTELVDYLLDPLREPFGVRLSYRRAWCHSVLHLPAGQDFRDRNFRQSVRTVLSALAQIHARTHPGEISGSSHALQFYATRTHIAAISLMGAAHAVVRQPPLAGSGTSEHPFDGFNQLRAHNTYFVPYLLASLQRLVLHRFLDEAQDRLCGPGAAPGGQNPTDPKRPADPDERGFLDLRRKAVKFGLSGELLEISQRSPLQAYYRLARQASEVPRALRQLRGIISEWDGIQRAERLHETAQGLHDNVEKLKQLQSEVRWVEVLIVSVYVVHLSQIVGEGFGFESSWWHGVSLLVLSLLATILACVVGLYPGEHDDDRPPRRPWWVFVGVFGLLAVYLVANFLHPHPAAPEVPRPGPRPGTPIESQVESPASVPPRPEVPKPTAVAPAPVKSEAPATPAPVNTPGASPGPSHPPTAPKESSPTERLSRKARKRLM